MCDLILYVQIKNQLCRDGSSCVDPVLSKINASCNASCSRTQCKLGPAIPRSQVKHSTTEPLRPPFCCLKKMQCSFINTVTRDKIVYTGLLVISFAACFVLFVFLCVFLQQIMLILPRAVAHLSRVIRLPPSMWHFYMNRMQRA